MKFNGIKIQPEECTELSLVAQDALSSLDRIFAEKGEVPEEDFPWNGLGETELQLAGYLVRSRGGFRFGLTRKGLARYVTNQDTTIDQTTSP